MSLLLDGTNGITFNNATTQASAGSVLQVVNATYGTYGSTTSLSFVDTGLTATITPKFATSKILVSVSLNGVNGSGVAFVFNIANGSNTQLLSVNGGASTSPNWSSPSAQLLHSPATTSAYTYKVQFKCSAAGTVYFNNYFVSNGDTNSTITLMEIAG